MLNLEIAKIAGVSPATVSRVINGRPGVSKHVAEHIKSIIEQKGIDYSELVKKRSKKPRSALKTKTVAVLILSNDIFHNYASNFIQLINSIERHLHEQNINMLFVQTSSVSDLPEEIRTGIIDGLVLSGFHPSDEILERIKHIPSVWISSHYSAEGSSVVSGNDLIGEIAARYLIERGHKHLCFINAFGDHPGMIQRANFFKLYAHNNNIDNVDILINRNGTAHYSDIVELKKVLAKLIDDMLNLPSRPTGLFVPHDIQVALLYDLLYAKGVSPGREIDVIGCDNDRLALAGLYPKPATIDILPDIIGKRAVQELIWKMENPSYHKFEDICVAVKPKLVMPEDVC